LRGGKMRELKRTADINKLTLAFFDYSRQIKSKEDIIAISNFILFFEKLFYRYDRRYKELIKRSHQRFIKQCEERGFSNIAKEVGLSRQAIRKKYIKYGGKKIFRNIEVEK
jgi:DNA-binding phage protein